MKYTVVLNESEEGFSISCPAFPGCWSQGRTEKEALENIQEAITDYLAAVDELAVPNSNSIKQLTKSNL